MWQQWITGLIVALAAAYMVWRWLPAGLRKKLGRVHSAMGQSAGCDGGGGGGGMMTSWITTASSGFFKATSAFLAVPDTMAQPIRMCSATTIAKPL